MKVKVKLGSPEVTLKRGTAKVWSRVGKSELEDPARVCTGAATHASGGSENAGQAQDRIAKKSQAVVLSDKDWSHALRLAKSAIEICEPALLVVREVLSECEKMLSVTQESYEKAEGGWREVLRFKHLPNLAAMGGLVVKLGLFGGGRC